LIHAQFQKWITPDELFKIREEALAYIYISPFQEWADLKRVDVL
jgi:hypothetical protein